VLGRFAGTGRLARVLAAAAEARVSLRDLSAGAQGGVFLLPLLNVPDWAAARRTLESASIELQEGLAVVSVVGDGLAATPASLQRFVEVIGEADHVIATPLRLSAVIDGARVEPAQRALHAAFGMA